MTCIFVYESGRICGAPADTDACPAHAHLVHQMHQTEEWLRDLDLVD